MTYEALMKELKGGKIRPLYLLEGEEEFFIDRVSAFFEHQWLSPEEREFNQTVFYGRDADWTAVLNACRRYPMFSERQLVMIKEAQSMKELPKLEAYVQQPLASTVLVIAYKHGTLDKRTRFSKLLNSAGAVMTSARIRDDKVPDWARQYILSHGQDITDSACHLLAEHTGSDLSRLVNEIDKMLLNIGTGEAKGARKINEDDIERYVGISKEYNVFQLQDAIGDRDMARAMRIIRYYAANPKAAPTPLLFGTLYSYFSKAHLAAQYSGKSVEELSGLLRLSSYLVRGYVKAARTYRQAGLERALLFLHEYNLRVIGVNDAGTSDAELLKEMVARIMH